MANLAVKRSGSGKTVASGADHNAVYKVVVKEMKNLQRTVESPSGSWTLITDRTRGSGGAIYKQK